MVSSFTICSYNILSYNFNTIWVSVFQKLKAILFSQSVGLVLLLSICAGVGCLTSWIEDWLLHQILRLKKRFVNVQESLELMQFGTWRAVNHIATIASLSSRLHPLLYLLHPALTWKPVCTNFQNMISWQQEKHSHIWNLVLPGRSSCCQGWPGKGPLWR